MQDKRYACWCGFSLVELMAVVTVMGVLVALALPRFRTFITRGRQAEAVRNLGIIRSLQTSYHLKMQGLYGEDDIFHMNMHMGLGDSGGTCDPTAFGTKNTLGFRVEDCERLRYTYYTQSGSTVPYDIAGNDGHDNDRLIYPGCSGSLDIWHIKRTGELTNHRDSVEACGD